jgi:excisionase family DNA binding protein
VVCPLCGESPPLEERRFGLLTQIRDAVESMSQAGQKAVPRRKAYPLREAATLLGISLTKLKDELRDGKLAAGHAGRRRRILDAEIARYLLRSPR